MQGTVHSQSDASDPDPTTSGRSGGLPDRFDTVAELEEFLSQPSQVLIDDLAQVDGDILILGVAGKMGPTLARLARNAAPDKRIIGVARFSEAGLRDRLEEAGIETIVADLLDEEQVARLSTGNIYPLVNVLHQGAVESTPPGPRGEYAQSCLGRERLFEYFSHKYATQGRLIRLNYAIDLRYGVLFDLASRVKDGVPIDLSLMGHVNVIWQGDANAQALRSLRHCTAPTSPLNVSGPETLSVRWLAREFSSRLGKDAKLVGEEAETAWLTNSAEANKLFGYPAVPLAAMLDWVADWVAKDGPSYNKPTKFEVRDGDF
jgi:nucleoside-diphosphate-sugar epimerase